MAKVDAALACENYLMNSDSTFCSNVCIYPDILNSAKNACVKTCDGNTIPDESKSPVSCIPSANCAAKLSSDSTACITDCSFVKEQDPAGSSKVC